jgi:hypothetical protein
MSSKTNSPKRYFYTARVADLAKVYKPYFIHHNILQKTVFPFLDSSLEIAYNPIY